MLLVSVLQTFGSVIARAVWYFGNVVFSKQWAKLARSLWGGHIFAYRGVLYERDSWGIAQFIGSFIVEDM